MDGVLCMLESDKDKFILQSYNGSLCSEHVISSYRNIILLISIFMPTLLMLSYNVPSLFSILTISPA